MSQREQVELERIRAQLRILAEEVDALSPDHGTLSGLGDDDHTQYALADGSRGAFLKSSDIGSTVQGYDADTPTVAASTAEMEAGTETALRSMSPADIAAAIAALESGGGGGGGGSGAWEVLDVQEISSGDEFDFTDIPAGYGALKVLVEGNCTAGATGGDVEITFNGSTTGYSRGLIYNNGGSAAGIAAGGASHIDCWMADETSQWELTLTNYDNTSREKIALIPTVIAWDSSTGISARHYAGLWNNTAAIDRITIAAPSAGTMSGKAILLALNETPTPQIADGTWEVIETLDVAAGTTIDFTSIPAGYGALKAVGYMDGSSAGADIEMTFNGDTSANYDRAILYNQASGSTAGHFVSSGVSSIEMAILSTAGIASFEVLIPGYDVTGGKRTVQGMSVRPEASGVPIGFQCYGQWDNTADAIDQVTFTVNAGTMTGKILLLGLNTTPAAIDRTGWKVIEHQDFSAVSSVDFSSIPATYKALKITGLVELSSGTTATALTFNGDTSAAYSWTAQFTDGNSNLLGETAGDTGINIPIGESMVALDISIPGYQRTDMNKGGHIQYERVRSGAGDDRVYNEGFHWADDSAIDQITWAIASGTITGQLTLMGLLTE